MLLFLMIMATVILFVPGITAEKAKQSAWMAPLLASGVGFISLWVVWKLGQRFPGKTLPQYSEILVGKIFGKILAGGYVLFFLTVNVLVIREFSEFLTVTLLPETPGIVLTTAIVLVGVYSAAKGIEVIARMVQIILPLFIFTLLFMLVLAAPGMELGKLLPLMEGGVLPIVRASVAPASWYGEIVVLVMLLPMVNKPKEVKRKGVLALLAAAVFLTLDTVVTLAVFGPNLTGNVVFPFWFLVRYIEFGNYLQRVESLIVVLWVAGIVLKVALFSYLVCFTTAQVLGLKKYKPVLYPAAPVQILIATYLAGNTQDLSEILDKYWPPFGLMFEVVLPVVLLAVAVVRRKKVRG
jgi:spore germination protein KB